VQIGSAGRVVLQQQAEKVIEWLTDKEFSSVRNSPLPLFEEKFHFYTRMSHLITLEEIIAISGLLFECPITSSTSTGSGTSLTAGLGYCKSQTPPERKKKNSEFHTRIATLGRVQTTSLFPITTNNILLVVEIHHNLGPP
jgi:hypothetical protein